MKSKKNENMFNNTSIHLQNEKPQAACCKNMLVVIKVHTTKLKI
jgi:hypothetical protein